MSDIYGAIARANPAPSLKDRLEAQAIPQEDIVSKTALSLREGFNTQVMDALSKSSDPESEMAKWELAKTYSDHYGITPASAYAILPQLNDEFFVGKPLPKTLPRAVSDSFKAASLSIKLGKAMSDYMGSPFDITERLNLDAFTLTDEQKQVKYEEALSLASEMEKLQIDAMPKAWYRTWMKTVASVIPYTADVAITGAVAAGATALVGASGGFATAGWFQAVRSFVAATSRFAEAQRITRGLNYIEMTQRGIPEQDAKFWADVTSAGTSAVEAFIGVEARLGTVFEKGITSSLAENIIRKLSVSGLLMSPAAKFAGRIALDTLGEMVEEGSQSAIDGIALMIAQSMQEEGSVSNPVLASEVAKDMATSVWQAMITAPLLGLGGDVMLYFQDKKALATLAGVAPSMKKDDFAKLAVASTVFQNVPPGAATELAEKMWAAQTDKEAKKLIEAREQVKAQAKAGPAKGDADIDRTAEGMVYVTPESQPTVGPDGAQTVTFLAGSAKDGRTMYGDIEVTIQNGRVTINGGNIDSKFTGYASEMLAGIAARYPGMKVELGESVEDAALIGGYEKLVADRGDTPFAEQNEADAIEEDRLYREITANISPDPAVAKSAIAALRAFSYGARKDGKAVSFAEFVSGLGFRDLGDLGERGSGAMGAFVKGVNGLVNSLKDPMIYGDSKLPSSLLAGEVMAHEGMHYFRAFLSKYDPENLQLKAVEKEYGISNGIWDMASDERFVADFLAWTRDRTAPSEEMGNIFQRIGEFLKKVYQAIKGEIPAGVRKAFDEWFASYEGENVEEIELGEMGELTEDQKMDNRTHTAIRLSETVAKRLKKMIPAAMAKTGRPKEYYEELIRMFGPNLYDMGTGWLMNPVVISSLKRAAGIPLDADEQALLDMANGMTEGDVPAQPLFAEAPDINSENFKKWFRDSKVVDEDGKPLVVYHGNIEKGLLSIPESFEAGFGIFLTDNSDVADTFTTPREYGEPIFEDEYGNEIEAGETYELYASIVNPLVITGRDAQDFVDDTGLQIRVMKKAKTDDYDGIILRDVMEGIGDRYHSDNYIVFSPTQIKSVNNSGAWGLNEPNIYKAEAPDINSENFKKWFRDSKVVDEDGKPLVVYHGGLFNKDVHGIPDTEGKHKKGWQLSFGMHFAVDKSEAEAYVPKKGRLTEAYLSLQNPLRLMSVELENGLSRFTPITKDQYDSMPVDLKKRYDKLFKSGFGIGTGDLGYGFAEWLEAPLDKMPPAKAKQAIKDMGYDGVIYKARANLLQGFYRPFEAYIAFDPSQVKSINNSGAWGINEKNVLKAEGNPDFFRETLNEGETQKDRIRADYETDAKDYASFEKWMDSQYASWDSMAESDVAWHRAWYEHAHSKEGKEKQYPKKGDFLTFLRSGNEFRNLMYHIGKALYGKDRYLDDASEQRASRIQGALSRSPEVMRAVEAMYKEGKTPATAVKNRFLAEARKHESLYKYLYALVTTDENLAYEALSDLKSLPLLARRELTGSEQISIVDQAEILDALRGTELAEKLKDGSISMKEVREYVKMIESKAKVEVKGAKRDAKRELREKLAARKLLREMERIERFIMRKPSSGSVSYFHASLIRAIQDAMKAEKPIDKKSLPMAGSYYATTDADWNAQLDSIITFINNEVARSAKKGSLDIEALKGIASIIKGQLEIGRRIYREEQLAWGLDVKNARSKILSEFMGGKYYKPALQPGSEEYRKQQKKLDAIGAQFDADRPDAWIRTYMGKEAAELLFNESLRARSLALENYDRRVKPVIDFIAEHKMMKKDKLLRTVTAKGLWGGSENITTMTGSELVGMYALVGTETEFNQWQRDAFIYGNLFTAEERDVDGTIRDPSEPSGNQYMMGKYKEKLDAVLAFIKANITDEEVALAKTMIAVMNNDFDWYRFAHTMVGLTNDEPGKEAFYFPILREGMFEDGEDETLDKLWKSFEMTKLDNRMAIQRRKIQPKDQKPVKYDALSIFYEAVSRQEYLTEVGPYIKKIRGVWKHNIQSRSMRDIIRDSIGQKGLDYIDKQIDTLTNPAQFKKKADGSEMLSFFRGAFVVSNLSWRLSSVVMQLLTSPMTGYVEAPLEMIPNSIKAYTNPNKFIEETEALSPMLRHRHILPEHADMLKRQMLGASNTLENIGIAGMKWLDIADRVSVAIVWKAIYDKRTKSGDGSLEAADYADRYILQTQPTSEAADRAPMYRDQDSFKALVLQFTQPMNVIYNNLRHDIPELAREKEFGKICMFVTAYAMSGIAIAAVGVLRGRGPDDPDEEKWVKYWLHASTSQFTDAIPFVGDIVTGLTGTAIIGDNNSWLRNDKNMPAFDLVARGVEGLFSDNRDYAKVMVNVAKGMGMMASAPVKAVEDMVKLTKSMLGEE